jgi:DNA-binding CsgD family transcriptional regulator
MNTTTAIQIHPGRTSSMAASPGVLLRTWHEAIDPAEAWHTLMRGGWTVAEHVLGQSERRIVARLLPPWDGDALEAEDVRLAVRQAQGAAIKELAFESGSPYGAVAQSLAKVMRTLRLRSHADLVALFHEPWPGGARSARGGNYAPYAFAPIGFTATRVHHASADYLAVTYPAPRWSLPPCLTSSEQSVVLDLIGGASHQTIALRRGTSPRTIANQVASIYGKLKVHSRIELFIALRLRWALTQLT